MSKHHSLNRIRLRPAFALFLALCLVCDLLGAFASAVTAAADTPPPPLEGLTISIMGDSISTYTGWSDKYPITDESCEFRYGEAYYGPKGGDFHNTDLLVTDTWWHQAATELGLDILMSNAGNSSGVLTCSYPYNAGWDRYLKDMVMYKSRPYYLGRDGRKPDIIALYVGSADAGVYSNFGSVEDVDFDALITRSGNAYVYATPTTVAEAYCILMHKISVTYPDAEVYCFAVVPHSGGTNATINKRYKKVAAFNEMMRGVAKHFGAIVVDLPEGFGLDPDGDGVISEAAQASFDPLFNGDPHPNAKGFDVITRTFVETVRENSRYMAEVETTAGEIEEIPLTASARTANGVTTVTSGAKDYVTPNGLTVNYQGKKVVYPYDRLTFTSKWTSDNPVDGYHAEGGSELVTELAPPRLQLAIPLTTQDHPHTAADETLSAGELNGPATTATSGDPKANTGDGEYDYTVTSNSNTGSVRIQTLLVEAGNDASRILQDASMTHYYNANRPTETNGLVFPMNQVATPDNLKDMIPAGYDYVYIGSDLFSGFCSAHLHTIPKLANEKPVYQANGVTFYGHEKNHNRFYNYGFVAPRLYMRDGSILPPTDPRGVPARWSAIEQFTLMNKNGQRATAYCADQATGALKDYAYKIHNIDDANYYDAASAMMIRSVARNGYWGTASGEGSLPYLKQKLQEAGVLTAAEAALLNDGMALAATQFAIWTYSNHMTGVNFINVYNYGWDSDGTLYPDTSESVDKAITDVIFKVYRYLISLQPASLASSAMTSGNTVINEKNFLESMAITLTEKADHANNRDDNPNNDVYLADVTFTLKVKVLDNDENIVMVIDDGTNKPIIGRLAGKPQAGDVVLTPVNGRTYTLSGVLVEEGAVNLSFSMYGYQNLDNDVYLYLSETKDNKISQPFVGVAKGHRAFNENLKLVFDVAVEDGLRTTERVWRTETPAVPPTGDAGKPALWLAALVATGTLLAVLRRKRKHA